ncbi:MAG TPA: hypothetical protein VF483_11440 [Gemmatimonadaceae bacterium]
MTDANATPPEGGRPLQFEKVEGAHTPAGMTCAYCGSAIAASYYDVNGKHACLSCKMRAERASQPAEGWVPFAKAFLFGGAACLLGAAIYYGVAALLNLEIGLVAILIGYLVGAGVRKGTQGVGGRRYQVLALVLTYFSIGLAYAPFALKDALNSKSTPPAVATDSPKADSADVDPSAAITPPPKSPKSAGALAGALALVFGGGILMVFALPILSIVGDLPGGLISAAIIGFGMRQAWRMTAARIVTITGPYRVGGSAPPPATTPAA